MLGRPGQADLIAFGGAWQADVGARDLQRAQRRLDLEQPMAAEERTRADAPAHDRVGFDELDLLWAHDVVGFARVGGLGGMRAEKDSTRSSGSTFVQRKRGSLWMNLMLRG